MTRESYSPPYTCNEYRIEMILLALERRRSTPGISEEEKQEVDAEIARIKKEMDMA